MGEEFAVATLLPSPLPHRITLRRISVDGLQRVSPLGGIDYLQFLAGLHATLQVGRYLEIGTQHGMSLQRAADRAVAVDPHFLLDRALWRSRPGHCLFEMTSDAFFAANDPRDSLGGPVEMAFIDGMHLSEFVLRDFVHVERFCTPESLIVLHDAVPQNFEMTERVRRPGERRDRALAASWTGDVWRVVPILRRERPDLCVRVLDCPPTGLVLVSNLNPRSGSLAARLPDLTRSLAEHAPKEAEFWSFIETLPVFDSRALL